MGSSCDLIRGQSSEASSHWRSLGPERYGRLSMRVQWKRRGLNGSENRPMSPTDRVAMVSPWYPCLKAANFVRLGCERCFWAWYAILRAISTAVEPLSARNTLPKWPGSRFFGAFCPHVEGGCLFAALSSFSQSETRFWLVVLAVMTCSNWLSCCFMAFCRRG